MSATYDIKIQDILHEKIKPQYTRKKFLNHFSDYCIDELSNEFDMVFVKKEHNIISFFINGNIGTLYITNTPVASDLVLEGCVNVFYLFNYYNFEQLLLAMKSYFTHVLLKEEFKYKISTFGYYDVYYSKHEWIPRFSKYIKSGQENMQYYHFKETISDRKIVLSFLDLLQRLKTTINTLDNFEVTNAIQSGDSEAIYLFISYKEKQSVKFSIRNHPIFTKCQVCFYYNKYDTLDDLFNQVIKFIKEYDWDNQEFSREEFLEITPTEHIVKKIGQDKEKYSKEQLDFIQSNQRLKEYNRMMGKSPIPNISYII